MSNDPNVWIQEQLAMEIPASKYREDSNSRCGFDLYCYVVLLMNLCFLCLFLHFSDSLAVSCAAPVNIAVIKYWGKRIDNQGKALSALVPINSSLSGTIDMGSMRAVTTIIATKGEGQDRMFLNRKEEDINSNKRLQAVIAELRTRAQVNNNTAIMKEVSTTNFDTQLIWFVSLYCL